MLHDFLFELGTEELPSGSVLPLGKALADNLVAGFANANIQHGSVRYFATPRRLAVLVEAVVQQQPPQTFSRRGPSCSAALDADGQPTPALVGFAKACGVAISELTTSKTDKGEWWVYEGVTEGVRTRTLLPSLVQEAVAALPVAKPMRWGNYDALFARPVHWAVLLFGEEVIEVEVLGVVTGRHSVGHRFLHPQTIAITAPRSYETELRSAFVEADFAVRRHMIVQQVEALALEHNAQPVLPDALVDEVTSIVEWPQALLAHFEPTFLEVPPEALIAAMQVHQKCFALRAQDGQLLPYFITVANILSSNPSQVIAGNERVMRARLSGAAFFFRQDKRQTLSQYQAAMEHVVFQQKLGSLQDKVARMQVFMEYLTGPLQLDPKQAFRAAELSKCDLMTGMVGEFPELQGLMGYYYALNDGEDEAVALALNEQYMPRFAADHLPQSSLGLALSLVDRLDTIVGIFGIGQRPTGVKDPFKLRRHALAIVRLLRSISAPLHVSTLIEQARHLYGAKFTPVAGSMEDIKPFILDRLQSFYVAQGVAPEIVHAVRARQDDWIFDMDKRIHALLDFIRLPEAVQLSAACKRVNNLLRNSDVLNVSDGFDIEKNLMEEPEEHALLDRIQSIEHAIQPWYSAGEYGLILKELAGLRESVDAFFERVMVMVDRKALQNNRLRLLVRLQAVLQGVADISLLQLGS